MEVLTRTDRAEERPDAGAGGNRPGLTDRLRLIGLQAAGFVVLTVVMDNAHRVLPRSQPLHRPAMPLRHLLGDRFVWDGVWYLRIARDGYFYRPGHQSSVAFFPLYPMAVRTLGWVTGLAMAALLISVVAGAVAVQLFWTWCRDVGDKRPWGAVVALAAYPYAFFLYGFAYSDGLFLSLSLGAFLAVHRRRYHLAGLLGLFATLTRPTGICLVVGLVAVALYQERQDGNGWPLRRLLPLAVSPAGLLGWCIYLGVAFDDPLAFVHAESAEGWGNAPGWHTWLKIEFIRSFHQVDAWGYGPLVAQAVVAAVLLALIPVVWRRYGWGYGIYTAVALLVPLISTGDFQGTGRYGLAAFPVFAVVGTTLSQRPGLGRAVAGASVAAMFLAVGLFSTGHLVS